MPEIMLEQAVTQAAELIRAAQRGVVLTGAGISTPSGIPDFRTPGSGLWSRYNPMEVASLSAFRHTPGKFYAWMRPLARTILEARPNPAHLAVARLEEAGHIQGVITQNIDGLHQKAGSRQVWEVHGSLDRLTCVRCYRQVNSREVIDRYLEQGEVPHCPQCGAVLKPDVVLFEEQLPYQTWRAAEEACATCDLMLVAGSSLEVVPVAGLPMRVIERGAPLIIINNSRTYINGRADVVIHEDVAVVLPKVLEKVLHA